MNDDFQATHRHYKGGLYREIGRGKIEADQTPAVIYANEFGEVWVRPAAEFDGPAPDGVSRRFIPLLTNDTFDQAAARFTARAHEAAHWKHNYPGATYGSRIKQAIVVLRQAIEEVEKHL